MTGRERAKRMWNGDSLPTNEDYQRAALDVLQMEAGQHRERNPIRQRSVALKAARTILDVANAQHELIRALRSMVMLEAPNSRLAWTDDEDNALITARANGKEIVEIAVSLGRTAAACATRLSALVGIPKDDIVNAYIEGRLEGTEVRGVFHGRVRGAGA